MNRIALNKLPIRRSAQQGAVLIVAMIMLVILTLLGVSGMNTTRLEERMAANTQEHYRAFQNAESGLSEAMASSGSWELSDGDEQEVLIPDGEDGSHQRTYIGWTDTFPRGELWGTKFRTYYFNFRSEGNTEANVSVVLNGGAFLIGPKPEGSVAE